ncbi:MAG: RelA/SpoT family protein, partial [Candidatus Paceibacterota bacterium]
MTLELILKGYESNFPKDKEGLAIIEQAAEFAKDVHKNQKRASKEPYFNHLLETANQLALWKLDASSIAAGFLHDSIEDCQVSPKQLTDVFGPEITFLVEGVTKLGSLKYRGEEKGIESLRKMVLAISKDLRVVFIKLADRLHNMRTLKFIPTNKQKRVALETYEIYSPLASRLGMQNLSGELEDLAFSYIHPEKYSWLKKNVKETYEQREKYLKEVEPIVREKLNKAAIYPISIDYRAKRLASLYKKLMRYEMNIEQIYDLMALRIVVKNMEECYSVMGIIHQMWPPMPGRIKDYIALPKPNGYQSLHTTVFCLNNRPTEFQIRTESMHEQSENGAAAHWMYETKKASKEYLKGNPIYAQSQDILWVKQLKDWQNQFPGSKEFLEALKIDFFSDRIFVLTPRGKVIDLPATSTPIDFAYKIHTDVGNACIGAKINN